MKTEGKGENTISSRDSVPKAISKALVDYIKTNPKDVIRQTVIGLTIGGLMNAGGILAVDKLAVYRVMSIPDIMLAGFLSVVVSSAGALALDRRLRKPKTPKVNNQPKARKKLTRDQLKLGITLTGTAMVSALFAMKGLEGIPELLEARKPPEKRFFEKIGDLELDNIVKSKLDNLSDTRLTQQDRIALRRILEKDSPVYKSFKDFVKFFGETYFGHNPELGPDYRTFLEQNFLPKLFSVFEDGNMDIVTYLTVCGYAGAVTGGDYKLDISQDRKRVVFNHLQNQELKTTGSDLLTRHLKFYAYSASELYGSVMGPRDGIRVGETSASISMHDQEIEVYFSALKKHWQLMPDKYQSLINTALKVDLAMSQIESERSLIGKRIYQYCMEMKEDDPILVAIKGSHQTGVDEYESFWDQVGLGVGIRDMSKLKNENLIVEQETHPTQVWMAMTNLVYGGARESEFVDKTYNETIEAFAMARNALLSQMDEQNHDPRINVYWLIKDQMFRSDFRSYVRENAGNRVDEWDEIVRDWDAHIQTVNTKNALTEIAYLEMGPFEYDVDFQMWLNKSISEYYVDRINKIPILNEYVGQDPLAQMVITMSCRELAPTHVWINDRSGPIAPHGAITPLNIDVMLNIWSNAISVLKENMSDFPKWLWMDLLFDKIDVDTGLEIFYAVRGKSDQSLQDFMTIKSRVSEIMLPMKVGPWSAYHLSKELYTKLAVDVKEY